jgi:MFS family permease
MISFNLILPELNEYISNMGGENQKGLIIFLFSVSALISRPFSGKLADTIGRKKVMYIGIVISVIASLIYPITGIVFCFLLLRFMHGFGAGFLPTGATALVTDVLPTEKRGVGMGIWGVFISLGFGIGQFLSSPMVEMVGLTGLFFLAAIAAVLAAILISFVDETLPNPIPFKWSLLKINRNDIFEPTVRPAAIAMFLSVTSSGMIFVLSPDLSEFFGLENKGWFFGDRMENVHCSCHCIRNSYRYNKSNSICMDGRSFSNFTPRSRCRNSFHCSRTWNNVWRI